jgi:hypothetical protein
MSADFLLCKIYGPLSTLSIPSKHVSFFTEYKEGIKLHYARYHIMYVLYRFEDIGPISSHAVQTNTVFLKVKAGENKPDFPRKPCWSISLDRIVERIYISRDPRFFCCRPMWLHTPPPLASYPPKHTARTCHDPTLTLRLSSLFVEG